MKTNRYAFLAFFLLLLAAVLPFGGNSGSFSEKLTTSLDIVATLAAAGGLIGLYFQFKRERDLSEADFALRLNQDFITNEKITRMYTALEVSKVNQQDNNPFSDNDMIDMANYLSFFGPFWGLIERGVVQIDMIDILAYRFFLATNNRFVQEMFICEPNKVKAWRVIYLLHKEWRDYRLQNELPIWQDEFCLSKTSAYSEMITSDS